MARSYLGRTENASAEITAAATTVALQALRRPDLCRIITVVRHFEPHATE
jgi:hypothetical protein